MSLKLSSYWVVIVRSLLIYGGALWLGPACLSDIDTYTLVQGVVQDSTGKPLPNFKLSVAGVINGSLLSKPSTDIEEATLTTDQGGHFEQNLHWHAKIGYFSFSPTPNPAYPGGFGFYPCGPPLNAPCELHYDRALTKATISIVIPARFR